jgi:hypothetical protein
VTALLAHFLRELVRRVYAAEILTSTPEPSIVGEIVNADPMRMTSFTTAICAIDAANAPDPTKIDADGRPQPAELVYGVRMSAMLAKLYPDASEVLQLACRGQHIKRWTVPRRDYPMDRAGYYMWRNNLKAKHAQWTGEIMAASGYGAAEIERVGALIRKEHLKEDLEAQALEDTACHVFLTYYADAFAAKHDDTKMATILKKSWAKMSAHGRATALVAPMSENTKRLVSLALEHEH